MKNDETPKPPAIPKVGEVLRNLDGWTYGEDPYKNRKIDNDDDGPKVNKESDHLF